MRCYFNLFIHVHRSFWIQSIMIGQSPGGPFEELSTTHPLIIWTHACTTSTAHGSPCPFSSACHVRMANCCCWLRERTAGRPHWAVPCHVRCCLIGTREPGMMFFV